ncbi:hypothetical protein [Neisseria sp. Marseille-Q2251]
MGVVCGLGKNKFVQPIEPPSPQPSPADGRGGGLQQMWKSMEVNGGG